MFQQPPWLPYHFTTQPLTGQKPWYTIYSIYQVPTLLISPHNLPCGNFYTDSFVRIGNSFCTDWQIESKNKRSLILSTPAPISNQNFKQPTYSTLQLQSAIGYKNLCKHFIFLILIAMVLESKYRTKFFSLNRICCCCF